MNYGLCIISREWPLYSNILYCAKSKFDQIDYISYQIGMNFFGNRNYTIPQVSSTSSCIDVNGKLSPGRCHFVYTLYVYNCRPELSFSLTYIIIVTFQYNKVLSKRIALV